MFLEIKTILNDTTKTGKFWSKWVDDVWEENYSHAVNLNSVKDLGMKIISQTHGEFIILTINR